MPTDTPDRREGLAVGDYVGVTLPGSNDIKYYRITSRDTLFYLDSHNALAAAAQENYTSMDNLNPAEKQLYQLFTTRIDGNVKLYLKQPSSTQRWGPQLVAEQYVTDRDMNAGIPSFNLWIMKNYQPTIQLRNDTNVTITPTLHWYGWKYGIESVTRAPGVYTPVVVGGLKE